VKNIHLCLYASGTQLERCYTGRIVSDVDSEKNVGSAMLCRSHVSFLHVLLRY